MDAEVKFVFWNEPVGEYSEMNFEFVIRIEFIWQIEKTQFVQLNEFIWLLIIDEPRKIAFIYLAESKFDWSKFARRKKVPALE